MAILNAPFEKGGWARALERLSRACGGSGANLVGFGGPLGISVNLFTGRNCDSAGRYFNQDHLWGDSNWRVMTAGRPMTVQHDSHYAAYRHGAVTADYDDAVSDLDMQFGCQSALISDSRTFLGLALFRGRREGACDSDTLKGFSALIRDVQRSLRAELALQGEASEMMVADAAALSSATVLIDRHGCICALTPSAEQLAGAGGPMSLCGLSFHLRNRAEDRQVQAAMRRLLVSREEPGGCRVFEMPVGRDKSSPRGRWMLHLILLPASEHGLGFDPQLAATFRPLP